MLLCCCVIAFVIVVFCVVGVVVLLCCCVVVFVLLLCCDVLVSPANVLDNVAGKNAIESSQATARRTIVFRGQE